ncbi:MAG: hypothetical protein JWM86_736 [Thermoleophilia bacterium]|nr:hypothetical protein [Thermoleophilia bacterium]
MVPRRLRSRLLDLAVTAVCLACIAVPFLPAVHAADSVTEGGGVIDEKVGQGGMISNPINGTFERGRSGRVDGAIQWDTFTTGRDGLKLVISTDRKPAMRDAKNGVDVPDYGDTPSDWNVGGSDRRFGFSVLGGLSLARFDDGKKWRGFEGKRAIEVGRRSNPIPITRTTIRLRAEFGTALQTDARPTANIRATAVANL